MPDFCNVSRHESTTRDACSSNFRTPKSSSRACNSTYAQIRVQTCIHAFIHTYIHTYICIYYPQCLAKPQRSGV